MVTVQKQHPKKTSLRIYNIHSLLLYKDTENVSGKLNHEPSACSIVSMGGWHYFMNSVQCLYECSLFGRFGLGGVFSSVQGLEEAEEAGCLADAAELDAEGLDLDEEVLHVDDFVTDQRLEEDAHQTHQTILNMQETRQM